MCPIALPHSFMAATTPHVQPLGTISHGNSPSHSLPTSAATVRLRVLPNHNSLSCPECSVQSYLTYHNVQELLPSRLPVSSPSAVSISLPGTTLRRACSLQLRLADVSMSSTLETSYGLVWDLHHALAAINCFYLFLSTVRVL